jgi:DNA-binding CsgD family transcriptional regulator
MPTWRSHSALPTCTGTWSPHRQPVSDGACSRGRSAATASEPALNQFRQRYCLSSAQCEILRCGLQGLRPSEIARERGVSINTIKTQIRQLLAKTGAMNLPMLIARVRGAAEI